MCSRPHPEVLDPRFRGGSKFGNGSKYCIRRWTWGSSLGFSAPLETGKGAAPRGRLIYNGDMSDSLFTAPTAGSNMPEYTVSEISHAVTDRLEDGCKGIRER